jgi:hypothetical protein
MVCMRESGRELSRGTRGRFLVFEKCCLLAELSAWFSLCFSLAARRRARADLKAGGRERSAEREGGRGDERTDPAVGRKGWTGEGEERRK